MNRTSRRVARASAGLRSWLVAASLIASGLMSFGCSHSIVDRLNHPVAITGCIVDTLVLADGRTLTLPRVHELLESSSGMGEGVEIDPATNVAYAIVVIDHWCGNDPVRVHRERVPLAALLRVLDGEAGDTHFGEWCFHQGALRPDILFDLVRACGVPYERSVGAEF